jgi:alpha-tubulin suppressor-like RCC1 family protein
VSGKTANDFTKPVLYTVTAADASKGTYAVHALVSKIVSISGYSDTLVVGSDGSLWAMGSNGHGQLGNGTTADSRVPVQIVANGVASASAGRSHSLFVKTDGSVWAMAYNKFGQMGTGATTDVLSPVQIFGSGVASAAAGGDHSLILKTDGSLWATGYNKNGQIGNGSKEDVLVPIRVLAGGVAAVSQRCREDWFTQWSSRRITVSGQRATTTTGSWATGAVRVCCRPFR